LAETGDINLAIDSTGPDPLEPFVGYITLRFGDDPHVWASALYDESTGSGIHSATRASSARCAWLGCDLTVRPGTA
jgi:hypothetical protein